MDHPDRFDPASVGAFRVLDHRFDPVTRELTLRYAFDRGPAFEESVIFETQPHSDWRGPAAGFERALLHLQIAAGTSYYKAAAPPLVEVVGADLPGCEAEFHRRLYDDGLREFAVANGLPVPLPVAVRPSRAVPEGADLAGPLPTGTKVPAHDPTARPGGLAVPIGGGKDSMVLIEALRPFTPTLFAVNPHPLVEELAAGTGLDLVVVRRRLDPSLAVLNRSGAMNGHVPITAIVSLIAVVGSFLYGYDAIAMAVERSASEETRFVGGATVNHQFSKSAEFEGLLRHLVTSAIDPGLTYASALRPYSELAIARAFAGLTGYHPTFCSCNRAFRQDAAPDQRWCGDCPKCRFVGLMLAPFLTPAAVSGIIGRDLFADPGQVAGFAALMSDEDKPFECVGERRESAAAIRMLSELPEWSATAVVRALAPRARALVSASEVASLLVAEDGSAFPDPSVAAAVDRALSPVP
jgi:hypothetical protein